MSPPPAEALRLDVGGRGFHALAWGDPSLPPVLLLHGFPEFSGAWAEIGPRLAGRFRCVAPDQRGYGRSWRPEGVGRYAMGGLVSDMAGVIDAMGGRAAVVGHDWGAAVAYGLAILSPGRVSRLVVVNGVHPLAFQRELAEGGAQAEASRYIEWLRREGSEAPLAADGYARLWRMFGDLPGALGPERRGAYEEAWGGAAGLRSMVDWYRAAPIRIPPPGERLAPDGRDPERFRIAMPHLVIWGMEDVAFVPEMRLGAEPFSGSFELEEVAGSDHWVIHREPDRVAERIARFLAAGAPG